MAGSESVSSVYMVVALVVLLCLIFTYTNGCQDGSSVCASALASRSMSRRSATLLVATFEFLGALLGGSAVAGTISRITSWPAQPDLLPVLASALFAAIAWNVFTRKVGIPASSTHSLVGGIVGSVVAASGGFQYLVFGDFGYLIHATGLWKVVLSLFVSPVVGMAVGYYLLTFAVMNLRRATTEMNIVFKKAFWLVVPVLAFGHGANDTQKAMGVIMLTLCASGILPTNSEIPLWVRLVTGLSMALGVLSLAPQIVRKVGGIYKLKPLHGLVSETASSIIVAFASATGGPLAASQVIASTVVGVGAAEHKKRVHWMVARDMVQGWCLTIPCAASVAWITYVFFFCHLKSFC